MEQDEVLAARNADENPREHRQCRSNRLEIQLQKMISLNGIWMVLLACVGLSITFTTLAWMKESSHSDSDVSSDFAISYMNCLLANFISIFFVATFWLMYLIDPLRWIKVKIVLSMLVTLWTAADIIFGFIIVLNVNKARAEDAKIQDNRVKLFVITILTFSSSCFFSRMAFMIEKKRRAGAYNTHNQETISSQSERDSRCTIRGENCALNIPGISDKPPTYTELDIDELPSYDQVTIQNC